MKAKSVFSCQSCGHQSPRWLGRCPDCGGWNTMKEERQAATGKGRPVALKTLQAKPTPIAEIEVIGEDRRLTGGNGPRRRPAAQGAAEIPVISFGSGAARFASPDARPSRPASA